MRAFNKKRWVTAALLAMAVTACATDTTEVANNRQLATAANNTGSPLSPCPGDPNCVCSCDTREQHAIEPLTIPEESQAPIAELSQLIQTMPRVEIVKQSEDYLHATFTSLIFRFTDDVEFYRDGSVIQVRSESRIGYSDFGVNRDRIESIRALFQPSAQ